MFLVVPQPGMHRVFGLVIIPKSSYSQRVLQGSKHMIIRGREVRAVWGMLLDLKSQSPNGVKSCSSRVRTCAIMKEKNAVRQKLIRQRLRCAPILQILRFIKIKEDNMYYLCHLGGCYHDDIRSTHCHI
jgi:hypothetical protein